jgi:hypothetical protein
LIDDFGGKTTVMQPSNQKEPKETGAVARPVVQARPQSAAAAKKPNHSAGNF